MKRYIVLTSFQHRDGPDTHSWESFQSAEGARKYVKSKIDDSKGSSTKLIDYEIISVKTIPLEDTDP